MLNLKSVASWIEQFDETERPIAQYAVQELQFITTDEIKHDLSVALQELVDEAFGRHDRHILLDSVLSQEDVDRFLKERAARSADEEGSAVDATADRSHPNGTSVAGADVLDEEPTNEPVPYMDYLPSEVRDQESGSEKFLDLTIREELRRLRRLCKQRKRRSMILSSRNDFSELCDGDTVELILLTDNIGSGKQVIDFIAAIHRAGNCGPFRNCTVRVQVLAWTATVQGVSAIQSYLQQHCGESALGPNPSENQLFDIIYMRETPTYQDENDPNMKERAFEFFQKHGDPKRKKQSKGLGFGQAATKTVIIGSSCPNTVPDMFYSDQKNSSYSPLFPNKSIPNDITQYVMSAGRKSELIRRTKQDCPEEIRKARLVQAARRPDKEGDPTWRILIQAVLGKDKWAAVRAVKASYHQFAQSQNMLLSLGWITHDFVATERGEKVVRQYGLQKSSYEYRSAHHLVQRRIDDEPLPYYPQSMRGVR